jgi:predicted PurR-regulated permease PerM
VAAPSPAPSSAGPQRTFLILASIALVVGFLYYAQKVLIPLSLALLLTFVLMPVVEWLQRHGLRRTVAVLLAVLLAFSVLGAAGWLLTVELRDLAMEMPKHKENITKKINNLQHVGPNVVDELQVMWRDISGAFQKVLAGADVEHRQEAQPVRVESSDLAWFPSVVGPLVEFLATALLVVILVVFMLIRREDLRNRLLRLIGKGRLTLTTRALDDAAQRISRFLLMQFTINVSFGFVLGVGLALIGVPYALLWGFLAALFRFIPYVGIWVAAFFPVVLSVAISPDWLEPLLVFGLFVVLELFTANVMEPLLFSHSTGISTVALLVAVIFWTWLWGPIGLLLSTPLTTCLVVLGKFVPGMEFFDILLGDEPVLETEVSFYQRLLARDQDEAAQLVEETLQTMPVEKIYDEMLVPSLVRAKRDQLRDELTAEDEAFILRATHDILDDLILPQQQVKQIATGKGPSATTEQSPRPLRLILGCPAKDECDELALRMLEQLLEADGCQVEIASVKMLTSEMISSIKNQKPAAVVIASLPPGGLTHARYLCKRLHSHFPDAIILVGRWGQTENLEKMQAQLRSDGAHEVATTLLQSRAQILTLIRAVHSGSASQPATSELQPASSH